jgi:microcystin-dependent protein
MTMAATGTRYTTPDQFEVDQNGVPLGGAQLFFYLTNTTTPQATYQDVALTTPNTNPVIADSNGRFGNIFLIPSLPYKVQLWTAPTVDNPTGAQIWSFDPVGPASGGVPTGVTGIIGEVRMFAGPEASVPATWYPCYGQPVSRTTYASLYAVIGTLWGAGDGSTTFNLPDFRGRAPFGKDDMGGTPASRLTSGGSGVAGNTIGATGGNQLSQTHTHTLNDPTHTHTLTDPEHDHGEKVGQGAGGSMTAWNVTGSGTTANPIDINTVANSTGITIAAAATGITLDNYGSGSSQNVPPAGVVEVIIYAGV